MSDRRKEAVERYINGETSPVLAAEYGVHMATITTWVKAAGHKPRRGAPALPQEVRDQAVAAYLNGQSTTEVAAALGISLNAVSRAVQRAGHKMRGHDGREYVQGEHEIALTGGAWQPRHGIKVWVVNA